MTDRSVDSSRIGDEVIDLCWRIARQQEQAARAALRPRTGNVVPLGGNVIPIRDRDKQGETKP